MSGETILAVDDNPDNLGVLKGILERQGYRVRPAASGRMALASLRHAAVELRGVDLIMLDILMPEMDGYEVCRILKAQPATRDIPVIFISALSDPLDKVRAFEVGGVDYVTKPFNEYEVLARVRTHLQLHQLQTRLERQNDELEQVVSERTAALRAANAGLQQALQVRQDFLTLVSHELRTPLNVILGMASVLEAGSGGAQHENVRAIKSSGWHLLHLIDDILEVARRAGGSDAADEPLDVASLCESCLKAAQPDADRRRVTVELDVEGAPPTSLPVPSARLYQIVGNLLDNAVRFTPEGGAAGIKVYRQGQELLIDVWDTGKEIPEEERTRIFEPFIQLEEVMTRRHGGLGLGLTLARQLARLHAGTIEVTDRPGGGNLFQLRLPIPGEPA